MTSHMPIRKAGVPDGAGPRTQPSSASGWMPGQRFLTATLWTLTFLGTVAQARDWNKHVEREIWEDHKLDSRIVTPHTPWARPLPGTPLKVLFVINDGHGGASYTEPGTRLREVVELQQRLDVDADAVMISPKGEFYQGKHGEARARELLKKGHDVYVFGNVAFDTFSPELQYRILERVVREGAGLLCCGQPPEKIFTDARRLPDIDATLRQGIPWAKLVRMAGFGGAGANDATTADRMLATYGLGEGRGLALGYPPEAIGPRLAFRFDALTEYDYWMLALARAVLWAGKRPQPVTVDVPSPTLTGIPSAPVPITIALGTSTPTGTSRIEVLLRRADGWQRELSDQSVTLQPGTASSITVDLPSGLRAGDYFLDCLVRSGDAVVGSGAGIVTLTSAVGMDRIAAAESSVERGESVALEVTTRGETKVGDSIRIQLRDAFDRVLARQVQPITEGLMAYNVRIPIGDWATIHMRAEAVLMRAGIDIDLVSTHFYVPKRRRGQFNFVQWGGRSDVLEYYAWKQLAKAGWDVVLGSADAMPAFDVTHIPYTTRLLEEHDKDGVMKPVCWNHEPAIDRHVAGIVEKQKKMRMWGTFVYSLGDEGTTQGCCVHPDCLAAYRAYLETQYGSIDALNKAWKTEYAGFPDVTLLDRDDIMESGAIARGIYPRWYDRQAFSRYNLAGLANRFVEAFQAFDPHAVTGFEGTGGFGDDFDVLLDNMRFWSPYPSIGDDILRSVADRSHIRANWMGYHKEADPLINFSWRMVMKEMDSIWWWRYDGCGSWRGYISPVIDFWPATEELTREMTPVRQGLGDLLLQSEVVRGGIAIYYSLPSALCGKLGDNASYPPPKSVHANWLRGLYDLGLDIRYITNGTIAEGALSNDAVDVLILPMAQAIPQADADAIRAFVSRGGTVLADLRPGVMSGHCAPLSQGSLDDVFGIARKASSKAKPCKGSLTVSLNNQSVSLHVEDMKTDPGVTADSATVGATMAGVPILLQHTYGRGTAILLNLEVPDVKRAGENGAAPIYAFLRGLIAQCGVSPAIRISGTAGEALPSFETRVWRNGDMTIIGIWREMDIRFYGEDGQAKTREGRTALIQLPDAGHVYDLRNRRFLGKADRFQTSVAIGRANFFAVTPYPIASPTLELSTGQPSPGDMLEIEVAAPIPDGFQDVKAVFLTVITPDGSRPEWGRKPVLLRQVAEKVTIPVAWNAAKGTWRVQVRELFTGNTGEAQWVVP